ncbi:MAG: M23 family metallopeptidase, partial [Bacteroidota bacterium]
AAILAGLFFISPVTAPSALPPCPVAESAPLVPPPTLAPEEAFEPPTASPLAGMDLEENLTSGFGMRMHPYLKKRQMHRGIDLKVAAGTPVLATAVGEVIYAGEDGKYGIVVRIQHEDGYRTVFAHLERSAVEVGQRVSIGETIGAVGSTGVSTAPHLHYEVLKDNKPVDPLALLD